MPYVVYAYERDTNGASHQTFAERLVRSTEQGDALLSAVESCSWRHVYTVCVSTIVNHCGGSPLIHPYVRFNFHRDSQPHKLWHLCYRVLNLRFCVCSYWGYICDGVGAGLGHCIV